MSVRRDAPTQNNGQTDITMQFKHFLTKTNQEKATKLPLLIDGEDTGQYLMVKGLEARSVAQAKLKSQIEYARIEERMDEIGDEVEKRVFEIQERQKVQVDLSIELIDSWSFDEKCTHKTKRQLLEENDALPMVVIGHAASAREYTEKK